MKTFFKTHKKRLIFWSIFTILWIGTGLLIANQILGFGIDPKDTWPQPVEIPKKVIQQQKVVKEVINEVEDPGNIEQVKKKLEEKIAEGELQIDDDDDDDNDDDWTLDEILEELQGDSRGLYCEEDVIILDSGRRLCKEPGKDYFTTIPQGDIKALKQTAKKAMIAWNSDPENHYFFDFSKDQPDEGIRVKDPNPNYSGGDVDNYYVILRNELGMATALVRLGMEGSLNGEEYVSILSTLPFASAYKSDTPNFTQETLWSNEDYPIYADFPPISNESAREKAESFLEEKSLKISDLSHQGYSHVYYKESESDGYWAVTGSTTDIYHEFFINGDPQNKIWVDIQDGFIIDQEKLREIEDEASQNIIDPYGEWIYDFE